MVSPEEDQNKRSKLKLNQKIILLKGSLNPIHLE